MEKVERTLRDLPYNPAYPYVLPCFLCQLNKGKVCEAFPKGIPRELLEGVRVHLFPVKEQKGTSVLKLK